MIANTYGKTNPTQERLFDVRHMTEYLRTLIEIRVPKSSKTMLLGSPGSQNSFWRHLGSAKGEPEAHKGDLKEPNKSYRGCFETPLGSLGVAWGGSETCLGDSKGSFWSKIGS